MARARQDVSWTLSRRRWTPDDARQILAWLEQSGLSLSAFAAQHKVDPQRLYRWRSELGSKRNAKSRRGKAGRVVPVGFRELRLVGAGNSETGFEITLRSGHVVRIGSSFDAEALRRLLRAIDSDES